MFLDLFLTMVSSWLFFFPFCGLSLLLTSYLVLYCAYLTSPLGKFQLLFPYMGMSRGFMGDTGWGWGVGYDLSWEMLIREDTSGISHSDVLECLIWGGVGIGKCLDYTWWELGAPLCSVLWSDPWWCWGPYAVLESNEGWRDVRL